MDFVRVKEAAVKCLIFLSTIKLRYKTNCHFIAWKSASEDFFWIHIIIGFFKLVPLLIFTFSRVFCSVLPFQCSVLCHWTLLCNIYLFLKSFIMLFLCWADISTAESITSTIYSCILVSLEFLAEMHILVWYKLTKMLFPFFYFSF